MGYNLPDDVTQDMIDAQYEPSEADLASMLLPCGCLPNKADAHRVGCPDHPEGKPYRGTWPTPYGPEPMKTAPVGFVASRVRMHGDGWSGWGHELTHTCGWSAARRYATDAQSEALEHCCPSADDITEETP